MIDNFKARVLELSEYLGVPVDENADPAVLARAFGCDEVYLLAEPDLSGSAVAALARMGADLTERDHDEVSRFAAYLAHSTDD